MPPAICLHHYMKTMLLCRQTRIRLVSYLQTTEDACAAEEQKTHCWWPFSAFRKNTICYKKIWLLFFTTNMLWKLSLPFPQLFFTVCLTVIDNWQLVGTTQLMCLFPPVHTESEIQGSLHHSLGCCVESIWCMLLKLLFFLSCIDSMSTFSTSKQTLHSVNDWFERGDWWDCSVVFLVWGH